MELNQAIKTIQETAVKAERAYTVAVPGGGPANQYYLCEPGKTPQLCEADPRPRAYKASSIEGFCQVVSGMIGLEQTGKVCVYVGHDSVVAVLREEGSRLDLVTLPLELHEAFVELYNWDAVDEEEDPILKGIDQKTLAWKLRSTFAGTFTPTDLLPSIQSLRFKSNSEGETSVRPGRESMSRDVQTEAHANGKDVPGACSFTVPVFSDLVVRENQVDQAFEATIDCAIDLNMGSAEFTVRPLPDQCARAWRLAAQWVADAIRVRVPEVLVFVNAECS